MGLNRYRYAPVYLSACKWIYWSSSRIPPQCPITKDGALNVHLIAHSHMDAGWVKTFDEYYYGSRTGVSTANVQLIFHSVLSELLHDKRRKFTFSETAYFWRWWKEQRPGTRSTFRSLVQDGRIEFAGGGWTQNDEATLGYGQIIDLFTWGLRKINDTLGPCGKPKAAWQIDTYGHTREQVSLLAQMGYDGLFIGRVDHKERETMLEEDRMEFMWRGSDVLGKMSDIMTHTLFNLYNAPEGFCFDFLCSDEPIVDDPDNRAYNADKRVNDFISQIERQAKYYDHDNIVVTMGGDFTYQSAANWFMNMDKLINHINTHPANISDVNVFYSTPSCYLKAIYLYGRRDKAIYTERNDHLPYGSDAHTYWTGYYTSRPSLKYFIRQAHTFLTVVKQLTVIAKMGDSFELHLLRHAVNLLFHHDAVTGTSQQHVTNDFIRMLSEAIEACTKKVSNLLTYLTPTWGGSRRTKNNQQFIICHEMNISQCRFTEMQESMLLLVYNPLSIKIYHHIRMPAIALHYSIRDYNDEEVEYQLVPLPAAVINLPGRKSTVIQELWFEAENIPPLGYASYYIAPVRAQLEENEFARKLTQQNKTPVNDQQEIIPHIANEYLKVSLNKDSGLLESIQHVDGVRIQISQNFYSYSQTQQSQQSGAYSFRPDKPRPTPVTEKATYHAIRGTIVKEIRQRFTDWITQIIRLYRGEEFIEIEWVVGPVPIGNDLGKEIVTIFNTNITNNGVFHTDSNGRQMMKRTCWNETSSQQQKKPVSACYFPVTSRICIQSYNSSAAMCVLTDRTHGGTSYNEGELELMVHRRLLTDDGFGLEESLNEEAHGVGLVVKGRHRILFGNFRQEVEDQSFNERIAQAARRWDMEPMLFFTSGDKVNKRKWQNVRNKRYSAIKVHGLPRFIHILTLEPWKSGSVLLRLENTLEKPVRGRFRNEKVEGPEEYLNKQSHITVHLRSLFANMKIKRVRETTLAANQWLEDARQMDWSTRYVYNGGDDDILPEDNLDYKDDKTKEPTSERHDEENKEMGYSDEEQDYPRRKAPRKRIRLIGRDRKQKPSVDDNYRRKRSINITENIIENIINGTFNDKDEIIDHNTTVETTTLFDEEKTTLIHGVMNSFHNNYSAWQDHRLFQQRNINGTWSKAPRGNRDMSGKIGAKKPNKMRFMKNRLKTEPAKFFIDLGNSDEALSSEEDLSLNLKKRTPRKRKPTKRKSIDAGTETITEEEDVTKSIYEMYYKNKPNIHLKYVTSEEDREDHNYRSQRRAKNHRRRIEEETDRSQEIRKKNRRDQPIEFEQRKQDFDEPSDRRRMRLKKKGRRNEKVWSSMPFLISDHREKVKRRIFDDGNEGREVVEERRMRKAPQPRLSLIRTKRPDPRVEPKDQDYYGEEEDDRDQEEMDNTDGVRRKRAINRPTEEPLPENPNSEHDPDPPDTEPDYVITLRPTQIRTFIIWFHNQII
ncbi:lysosomal alpha-mannosidase-like [Hyposmocoma kahamanoa]|uniref:lysosomal alpha-mannosidase-like n=1 Tax=Hyposmocoma kahamanoa TaxID=1477025 RepID=UPI000E6D759D|nr:lysosomal alpha-mannosidase-like [Hyposmocoma kahamanoa]